MSRDLVCLFFRFVYCRLLWGALISGLVATEALAAALSLPKGEYVVSPPSGGGKLTEVLHQFARTYGLEVKMPSRLSDDLNGKIGAASPEDFLNKVCAIYGLVWHFSDGILYFSRKSAQSSITISLPSGFAVQGLRKALLNADVLETKFGWGEVAEASKIVVYGPPQYLRIVKRHLLQMRKPDAQPDEVYVFRFQNVPVRGVGAPDGGQGVGGVVELLRSILMDGRALPVGVDAPTGNSAPDVGGKGGKSDAMPEASLREARATAPLASAISEDLRNNAIVIRGAAEQLGLYKRLIAKMDVPIASVAIDVAVVDLRMSALDQQKISDVFSIPAGEHKKTKDIMAALQQLEADGVARVVTRQSLRTVDGLSARLKFSDALESAVKEDGQKGTQVQSSVTVDVLPILLDGAKFHVEVKLGSVESGFLSEEPLTPLPGDEATGRKKQGEWQSVNTLKLHEDSTVMLAANTYELHRSARQFTDAGSSSLPPQYLVHRYFLISVRRVQ